jgi:Protein kinase domain
MHTPSNRDPNRPGDGSSARTASHAPIFGGDPARGSSLVRLTPAPPTDLFAEPAPTGDDAPTVITSSPKELASPALAPGTRLGSYELMESIGTGGMATVIKARDVDLGRIVALKILPPATARDSEAVARFKLEARAAAKLDHDNIARVYFCGEDAGLHFIAFEFVEGENLRQVIDRVGRLATDLAVKYMLQLAAGLAHASERGVVHRDVKPSNILITPDGRAKIVDMGLARHLEGQSVNGGVTQSGVTLGTFDYISPEQALDPRRADIRSDLYSLGCAFYHALTGRPPVPEGTAAKKLQAHQHDQPTDPRDLNPAIGDALAIVLSRMMAKKPEHRYQTPEELAGDLFPLTAPGNGSTASLPALPARSAGPPPLPLAWTAAVALFVVAAAIFWNRTGEPATVAVPWSEPAKRIDDGAGAAVARPSVPAAKPPSRIADARGIVEALARAGERATIALRPGAVYDLTTLATGIVFSGTEIVFEPEPDRSDAQRPILRLHAAPPDDADPPPGTLAIRNAERASFRGIEIQIVDRATGEFVDDDPVGLSLHNVGRAEVENCLVRWAPESRRGRIVGIAVGRDARGKPGQLAVRRSLVDLGAQSIGVRIVERTETELADVGFGPHQAALLWADGPDDAVPDGETRPNLTITSSTFVFDRTGTAIAVGTRSAGGVALSGCVFAEATAPEDRVAMPGMEPRPGQPTVVRLDDAADAARFVVIEGPTANAVYRVTPPPGTTRFVSLTATPWNGPDPRPLLALAQPWNALQLNLNEKRLRVGGAPHILGVTTTELLDRTTRKLYDGAWPPQRPQLPVQAKAGQRVVHPDAGPEDATYLVYPTIAKAFEDLKPGETLLIAQNGPVPVAVLPERSLRATIAAFDGYSPLLEPTDETVRRPDASLFPLVDGELTFVGLQIHLKGRPAVVTMAGGTVCTFRNCAILLDEKDDESIAAVLLTEPTREMKMTPTGDPGVPRVRFENTVVQGRGRAVALRAPRAFEWTAENAVFALDGALLFAEAATRDGPPARGVLRWKSVTAVTLGTAIELRGSTARGLGLDANLDRCLFASGLRRRSLPSFLQLGNGEGAVDPAVALAWRSDGPTVYGNYDPLVELRGDGADRPVDWDAARWLRATGDAGRVAPVRFAVAFTAAKLRRLKLDDLKAEVESAESGLWRPADVGADPAKLPRPVDDKAR